MILHPSQNLVNIRCLNIRIIEIKKALNHRVQKILKFKFLFDLTRGIARHYDIIFSEMFMYIKYKNITNLIICF
jgi:hypothetical protein